MLAGGSFFGVTWYGGEPLLGIPVIERLTSKFKEICERKKAEYTAGSINGYLFTTKIVKQLLGLGIDFAQITVDGPKETHDSRRPLVGGGQTYYIASDLFKEKIKNYLYRPKQYYPEV
jgi:uncharacterized protein